MGLRADIQGAVTTAFEALGDLTETGTVVETPHSSSYDPVTDIQTVATVEHAVEKALLTSFKEEETDGKAVRSTDVKVLISATELGTYRPTSNDTYVDSNAQVYSIENVMTPPGTSLWILQVRLV
jgi:hypothetical protein